MINVKRVRPDVPAPRQFHSTDAGFDLYAAEPATLRSRRLSRSGYFALIPTGFQWEIPEGMVGLIRDKSGLAVKRGLTVRAGVIDSGYRGEVCVMLMNESDELQIISPGNAIAQMIVVPCLHSEVSEVQVLSGTERGAGGFGSTGA